MALFNVLVDFAARTADFESGIDRIDKRMQNFGESAKRIMEFVVAGAMVEFGKSVIDAGAQMQHMAVKAGVGGQAFSELAYAAKQSGTNADTLASSLVKMNQAMGMAASGGEAQVKALGSLGLTYKDLKQLKPEDQFEVLADRISKLTSESTRSRVEMALFGKSGGELGQLFEKGAKGIEDMRTEAQHLGVSFTDEQLRTLDEANNAIGRLKESFSGLATSLVSSVAPAVSGILDKFTALISQDPTLMMKANLEFLREMQHEEAGLFGASGYIGGGKDFGKWGYHSRKEAGLQADALQNKIDLQNMVVQPSQLHSPAMSDLLRVGPPNVEEVDPKLLEWLKDTRTEAGKLGDSLKESETKLRALLDAKLIKPNEFTARMSAAVQDFNTKVQTVPMQQLQELLDKNLIKPSQFTSRMAELTKQVQQASMQQLKKSGLVDDLDAEINENVKAMRVNVGNELDQLSPNIDRVTQEMIAATARAEIAVENFSGDVKNSLYTAFHESGSFGKNFLKDLMYALQDRLLFKAIDAIGDALEKALTPTVNAAGGGGGGWLGFLGSVLGNLYGGAGSSTDIGSSADSTATSFIDEYNNGGHRAMGGPIEQGKWYTAGENGPEPIWGGGPGAFATGYGSGSQHVTIQTHIDARGATTDLAAAMPAILKRNNDTLEGKIIDGLRRRRYGV